jgi:hypothetical protein
MIRRYIAGGTSTPTTNAYATLSIGKTLLDAAVSPLSPTTIPADRSHLGDGSDCARGAAILRCRTPCDGAEWNGGPE